MSENITWLKNEVEKIQFPENAFRIYLDEGVFIIGATKSHPSSTPDFFTIATIYETISDINTKIQFSFSLAEQHGALEENKKYNPFDEPTQSERIASYFIENIAFRVGILWDMLAQLYNEYWCSRPAEMTISGSTKNANLGSTKMTKQPRFIRSIIHLV